MTRSIASKLRPSFSSTVLVGTLLGPLGAAFLACSSASGGGAAENPADAVSSICSKFVACGTADNTTGTPYTQSSCVSDFTGWVPPSGCADAIDSASCGTINGGAGSSTQAICFPTCSAIGAATCNGNTITLCVGDSDAGATSGTSIVEDCTATCSANGQTYTGVCGASYEGQASASGQDICWCNGGSDASVGAADTGASNPALPCFDGGWCNTTLPASDVSIDGIWGSAADDVWAVGGTGATGGVIQHWDGSTWSQVDSGMYPTLFALSGTGTDDVWAVGTMGTALHWDGNSWSSVNSGTTMDLYDVWANSTADVWAVGQGGVLHWNGSAWSMSTSTGGARLGVWATGASDVWAVGGNTVDHWNGATWNSTPIEIESGTSNFELLSVSGSGPSDAWTAGSIGTMAHWNGHSWSQVWCDTPEQVTSVWANSPSDAWAVSSFGEILKWDGSAWTRVLYGTSGSFNVIWGSGMDDLWVGGTDGQILHHP